MNCSTGTLTARVLGDVKGPAHSGSVSTRALFDRSLWIQSSSEPHMSCDVPIAGRHHCPKACCTTREEGLNWWWKSWSRQTDTVHRYVGQGIRIGRATTTWIRTEAARENLRRLRCGGQHNPQTSGLVEEPTCKSFLLLPDGRDGIFPIPMNPVNNDIRHNSTPCYESNPHRKEQSSKWDITEKTHSHHMTRITSFFPRPPKLHLTAQVIVSNGVSLEFSRISTAEWISPSETTLCECETMDQASTKEIGGQRRQKVAPFLNRIHIMLNIVARCATNLKKKNTMTLPPRAKKGSHVTHHRQWPIRQRKRRHETNKNTVEVSDIETKLTRPWRNDKTEFQVNHYLHSQRPPDELRHTRFLHGLPVAMAPWWPWGYLTKTNLLNRMSVDSKSTSTRQTPEIMATKRILFKKTGGGVWDGKNTKFLCFW